MKRLSETTCPALFVAFACACSGPGPGPGSESADLDIREIEIAPRLVLGSEGYGDGESFGIISDAEIISGGRIAVLDRIGCCARVF